jgi:ATP-dependent RNA helicase DeaD
MLFADLSLNPKHAEAIAARGYQEPTPVQALMLSPEHDGRDALVSARTGSGKTLAFGLALARDLLGDATSFAPAGKPLALVVAPTRELAMQVQRELAWLYGATGAKVRACVGGMDPRREQRMLAEGAHLVVGTPGRLCDHLERRNLDVTGLRALVLDEADEMLDMGFREELERILRDAPRERRTLLFSATIPRAIEELAAHYQRNAVRIAATRSEEAHEDIEYRAHLVAPRERELAVVNTLRQHEAAGAVVFCATREAVTHLHASLVERGFSAVALSGELSQAERTRAITALRDGRARVLVATDVAARGLDLPVLELVVHADLPRDPRVLQHRSGRTGRAGKKGTSVLLVPLRFKGDAERLLRSARVKPVWSAVATVEQIKAADELRLEAELAALCADVPEEDVALARTLLARHDPERLLGALVRQRRADLPAPEELPETTAHRERDRAHRAPAPGGQRRPAHRQPSDARSHAGRESAGASSGRGGAQPVWFRVNVGRERNADPRWLLPLLCRRGGIAKADIGRIEIFAQETRVAIAPDAAVRFARAASRPDRKDPSIRIERLGPRPERQVKHARDRRA